ncbi:MAG: GHKL domain-containing protein [Clostridia bacterium]|nr:GHKL domain-containing protein [Clostridia bacterium]
MIRRLRFKLVLACMLALLIVLMVVIGSLNIAHYTNVVRSSEDMLALLRENGGEFPRDRMPFRMPAASQEFNSPELPHTTRYFSALISEGEIIESDVSRISAVDEDTLGIYVARAIEKKRDSGFTGNYRYLRYPEGENTRVLFLDCARVLSSFREVRRLSVTASALGYIAVFLLMLFLSGRIVRPVSESYEKQRRFITDAGHEIKTPLTIINADAEILGMEQGENEWLADIRSQTARLSALTSDLICLSRMEEQQKPEMIPLPLSDLVIETAASFQALARTQEKRFFIHVQPMVSICGSQKSLCQLISILLDNALKYSNHGGEICLSLEKQGKGARISVENSVDFISPETIKNMFDRFYRGDPSRSSDVKGYGIGLSIAKAIAAAHKGRIAAASPDGKSLKITVTLPG